MGSSTLADLSWELGVTTASSSADQIGQTYVRIQMKLMKNKKLEVVSMELSLPQFYNFLHELEKTHNEMKQYTIQM